VHDMPGNTNRAALCSIEQGLGGPNIDEMYHHKEYHSEEYAGSSYPIIS